MIKVFQSNTTGTDFFCTDIHGCYDALMKALTVIGFDKSKDRLFSCGDLVDRGTQNLEVLALLNEPWFFSIKGNHDQMLFEYLDGEIPREDYFYNGGSWTLKCSKEELEMAKYMVKDLPNIIQVGNIGMVHADINSSYWDDFCNSVMNNHHQEISSIWGRSRIMKKINSKINGIDLVILGHTVIQKPELLGNTLYLDTGVVFGMSMSIYNSKSEIVYQIDAAGDCIKWALEEL